MHAPLARTVANAIPWGMARVWIEPGCIQCGWCQNLEPRVFLVGDDGCQIRAEVREDHLTDTNAEHRALCVGALSEADLDYLPFVAGGCPTQVIQLADIAAIADPLKATA